MPKALTLRFWGVRGAIAVPGPYTVRYGGNTACVSLHLGDDAVLILDAGTGIRNLGKMLASSNADLYLVVTHIHWDHIQGFPFFGPIYQPRRLTCVVPNLGETLARALVEQMDGNRFPVRIDDLLSERRIIFDDPRPLLMGTGFEVERIGLNHPGGGFGYRVENEGRRVVYLTDNELNPPGAPVTSQDEFVAFCKDADVLIHDAQYLAADMPAHHGWGHSLVSQVLELAVAAWVKHLVLFHHDPDRSDDAIDAIQTEARAWLQAHAPWLHCTAAFEGLTIRL